MRICVADVVSMSSLFGGALRDMSGAETSVYHNKYINVSRHREQIT
jgi:hypothetical protein